MFDFNASLSDAAFASSILLPVDLTWMEKSGLLMDAICVVLFCFVFTAQTELSECSQLKLRFLSVVFDFNASLNDVTPVSPILLPVDFMGTEKNCLFMDAICVFL